MSIKSHKKSSTKGSIGDPLIRIEHLTTYFELTQGFIDSLLRKKAPIVHAVEDVTFEIRQNEILSLGGESGCGKTTLGRTIIQLTPSTKGSVYFDGEDLEKLSSSQLREYRKRMQIIFQDPYEALNPKLNVYSTLSEPLNVNSFQLTEVQKLERITKIMEDVQLTPPEEFMWRYPHQMSGGQRQRVAVARALILNPEFIFADEPVSMLDVSVRAEILNLLLGLRDNYGITFLFVTHDLAVASYIADRIGIMYSGKLVEIGDATKIAQSAVHPYSRALISAVPSGDPTVKKRIVSLEGEVPSPINPPKGCRFHTRCPYVKDICKIEEPPLEGDPFDHASACWVWKVGDDIPKDWPS